tara:strand:+ start:2596 stop:2793 length:198 start_codon:yes stop_codon:yes gene_type:complete
MAKFPQCPADRYLLRLPRLHRGPYNDPIVLGDEFVPRFVHATILDPLARALITQDKFAERRRITV